MPFTSAQAINLHYFTQQEISKLRKDLRKLKRIPFPKDKFKELMLQSQINVLTRLMRKAMSLNA